MHVGEFFEENINRKVGNGKIVTKIVLSYCEKKLFQRSKKNLEIRGRRPEIWTIFEEQFIQTVKGQNNFWFQYAFLACSWRFLISNELCRKIRIQIGKKYWDLETCRKS